MDTALRDKEKPYLTVRETAAELGLHEISVYRMIRQGRLPAIQLGGPGSPVRVDRGELREWLDRSRVSPAERRVPERTGVGDGAGAAGPKEETPSSPPPKPVSTPRYPR
jgi:excisionase family DNA binding protein